MKPMPWKDACVCYWLVIGSLQGSACRFLLGAPCQHWDLWYVCSLCALRLVQAPKDRSHSRQSSVLTLTT